jgi:phage repressor protein C with HTH and peptisase S24 domain
MPSADKLARIAETLNTTPAWLLGERDAVERPNLGPGDAVVLPDFKHLVRDLPIFGTALGADIEFCNAAGEQIAIEQTEVNMATAQDYMARPVKIAGRKDFYVVTVQGDSMVPRHDPKRRLLVQRKRPGVGDDVVVQLVAPIDDGREFTSVLIKTLVKRKADVVVLKQYTPETTFEVPINSIAEMDTIIPWDEAMGL